jgi:hypothetical protein
VERAQALVGGYILQETGQGMKDLISGIVPTLLLGLGLLGLTTGAGLAGGAVLGSFGAGLGAVPGGIFCASVGFEAGLALLDALGLGFLFAYVSDKLPEVYSLLRRGLTHAWAAPDSAHGLEELAIDAAARDIARAVAVLFSLILQAIVAFLMAKGAKSAAERLPELLGKLRSSEFGEGFASWVQRNYESLIKNRKLEPGRTTGTGGGGGQRLEGAAERVENIRQPSERSAPSSKTIKASPKAEFKLSPKQLQAKFKHAEDFGVSGNYNPSNAARYEAALEEHINAPSTQTIQGTYRGVRVIHKFDPLTNRNVIMDTSGNFVSGWKLSPDQVKALTTTGKLGGG